MKKKSFPKKIFNMMDALLLVSGMTFVSTGVMYVYKPAGLIMIGLCLIALAFFIAAKQAKGG